jgi:hypothetical protein
VCYQEGQEQVERSRKKKSGEDADGCLLYGEKKGDHQENSKCRA